MSEDDKSYIITRRAFNISTLSAGIASLSTPIWAMAQEQKKAPPKPKRKLKKHKMSHEDIAHNTAYEELGIQVKAHVVDDGFVELALYFTNRSEMLVHVPYQHSGFVKLKPKVTVKVGDKSYVAEDVKPHPDDLGRITRMPMITYRSVFPSGEDKISTLFSKYNVSWPKEVRQQLKSLANKSAVLHVEVTLERTSQITRSGKSWHRFTTQSEPLQIPKSIKAG